MIHLMLDSEFSSLYAPEARLMQVAIVPFNSRGIIQGFTKFNEFLELRPTAWTNDSESTMQWWERQPNWDAMLEYQGKFGVQPVEMLARLYGYMQYIRGEEDDLAILCGDEPQIAIWSKHHIDISILETYCHKLEMPLPWKHYEVRDMATAYQPYRDRLNRRDTQHWANTDAEDQVDLLVQCCNMGLVLA